MPWDIKNAVEVSAEAREKCTKQFVRIVRKSAKFLLSREATGPYIAKNVFPRERKAAAKGRVYWQEITTHTENIREN